MSALASKCTVAVHIPLVSAFYTDLLIDCLWVHSDRFDDVSFPSGGGIRLSMTGSVGETTAVTALQPLFPDGADRGGSADWLVQVKLVTFSSDTATVVFGNNE